MAVAWWGWLFKFPRSRSLASAVGGLAPPDPPLARLRRSRRPAPAAAESRREVGRAKGFLLGTEFFNVGSG